MVKRNALVNHKRSSNNQLLSISFIIVTFLILSSIVRYCSPSPGNQKMSELQQLALDTPIYSGFKEIESNSIVKSDRADLNKAFISNADYNDVRKFYTTELTQRGWKFLGERSLTTWGVDYGAKQLSFEKGEFRIAIQYEGKRGNDIGKNYGIDYVWISSGTQLSQTVRLE